MATNYEIIIYWNEDDNAFLAEVPELSGCMADGATQEDALQNIKVIMEQW
jgi:predicted RNase H-like HicB family nuclease